MATDDNGDILGGQSIFEIRKFQCVCYSGALDIVRHDLKSGKDSNLGVHQLDLLERKHDNGIRKWHFVYLLINPVLMGVSPKEADFDIFVEASFMLARDWRSLVRPYARGCHSKQGLENLTNVDPGRWKKKLPDDFGQPEESTSAAAADPSTMPFEEHVHHLGARLLINAYNLFKTVLPSAVCKANHCKKTALLYELERRNYRGSKTVDCR
uniref:Uncharacterized protein n=1 Tax=Ditylenchus dipsaci TaxID=166011 RepID=A0A915DD14_9BILA